MIIIEADLDGDGEFEPLSSVGVRQRVQSQLAVERAGPLAGISAAQVQMSWSSVGMLEGTSDLNRPWAPVPGNPGSPMVLSNTVENFRFFRVRQ